MLVNFDTKDFENDPEFERLLKDFSLARVALLSYLNHGTNDAIILRPVAEEKGGE